MTDQRYTTSFDTNQPNRDANRDDYRRDRVPEYAEKQNRKPTGTRKKTDK